MAVNTHKLSLDTDKSVRIRTPQKVKVRVGDKAADVLEITVTSGLEPLNLSGMTARVMAQLDDGVAVADCSLKIGTTNVLTATLGGDFAAVKGRAKSAYVEIKQGSTVVASTEDFMFDVIQNADISEGAAKPYESLLDKVAKRAEDLADEMQKTIDDADISFKAERLDPGTEPTVTESGSGLKKTVTLGLPSATAGVSAEQGPAGLLTFHGAADDAPVVEAVVWGETRQNLWINTSGHSFGITATENADGSISINGNNPSNVSLLQTVSYSLAEGKTYTASVDKIIDANNAFWVDALNESGERIELLQFGNKNTKSITFTLPVGTKSVLLAMAIPAGTAVSGTYRVMLNEGDTPAHWCPPGLSSAGQDDGSVRVVARGKNLLATGSAAALPLVSNGREFSDNGDGGIRVSGASESPSYYNFFTGREGIRLPPGSYTISCDKFVIQISEFSGNSANEYAYVTQAENVSSSFTLENEINARIYVAVRAGVDADDVFYPQLEFGGARTGWVRPFLSLSSVPLPAAHPYLASLPDGTRDELRVYWDGTAELVQRIGDLTIDGDAYLAMSVIGGHPRFEFRPTLAIGKSSTSDINYNSNQMCTTLKSSNDPIAGNVRTYSISAHWPSNIFYFRLGTDETSVDLAKAWLRANPVAVNYKLADEIVYYYDGATWSESRPVIGSMAELRSAGDQTHVWVESGPVPAEVEAHVLLEGGKALGKEHDFTRNVCKALASVANS